MEIEKISDDQIKFTLNKVDLEERDIQISDLSYGSEKSQELFKEIMEEAVMQCGFQTDGRVPLVVEAVPVADESLMIIVTKVSDREAIHERFDILPRMRNEGKFIEKAVPEAEEEAVSEPSDRRVVVYAFETLDDAANAAAQVQNVYKGESALVKNQKRFFLVLDFAAGEAKNKPQEFEYVLSDYGQRYSSSALSNVYLREHGEILIAEGAVRRLAVL